MQVKDSWLPVDLSQGGSAAPTPPTTPPPVQRIASPGIPDDWVLNMGSVSGPEWTSPGNRAGTPSPKPRLSVSWAFHPARISVGGVSVSQLAAFLAVQEWLSGQRLAMIGA